MDFESKVYGESNVQKKIKRSGALQPADSRKTAMRSEPLGLIYHGCEHHNDETHAVFRRNTQSQ